MTGRELIVYILENNLEDEPVFKDGKFIGFVTVAEAAEKMDVGVATICAWVMQGRLSGEKVGDYLFIPADCKLEKNDEKDL